MNPLVALYPNIVSIMEKYFHCFGYNRGKKGSGYVTNKENLTEKVT